MKKLHPIQSLRQWSRQHPTQSSFMTDFVATVLGIVLTFGTTMWYEKQQKAEAADALVERCLSNMETRLKNLDTVVEKYDNLNHLYQLATTQPLDSLDNETLYKLIDAFTWSYNLITNHAYEKSFSQSVNSHEILGTFANVIGAGYEYLLVAEENHEEINRLKKELRRGQILERQSSWDQNTIRQYVSSVLTDPQFVYFQEEFIQHEQTIRHLHHFLQLFIPEARRLWNKEITEDEFWKETNDRWNE